MSKDNFNNIFEFIKFSISPSVLLIIAWFSKQILTIEAGFLTVEELAS
jgi:hypothetical protein